jgi:hypothetical protein
MFNQSRKTSRGVAAGSLITIILAALLAAGSASIVFAGGFQLAVEVPSASDAHSKDAALLVRTFGCYQPKDANVTATAEGLVNGRRQSVPVEMKLDATGVYELRQQWPTEGTWMLSLTGSYNGMTCTVFVDLAANGKVHPDTFIKPGQKTGTHARAFLRKPTSDDIDAALRALTGNVGETNAPVGPRSGVLVASGAGAFLFLIGIGAVIRRRHAKS